ncbi:MAG TPA: FHA domain-containing protein, partial [Thermoleophilaceae bacterium]
MNQLKLQIIEGPDAGQELELDGPAVIGRDPGISALVLQDPEASRRHASLIPEGTSLNVEDLGSTNGTFVNGERIAGDTILVAGDRLRIGTTVLEVVAAPVGYQPPEEPEAAPYEVEQDADEVERAAPPYAAVSGGSPEQPPGAPPPGGQPPEDPGAGPGPEPAPPTQPPPAGGPPPAPEPAAPAAPIAPPAGALAARVDYPIDFQADYPEGGIARWRALLHGIMLIPHALALLLVFIGVFFAWIAAFFAILFTGRYPEGIF